MYDFHFTFEASLPRIVVAFSCLFSLEVCVCVWICLCLYPFKKPFVVSKQNIKGRMKNLPKAPLTQKRNIVLTEAEPTFN